MAISCRSSFSSITAGLMFSSCSSRRTNTKKNLMLGHIKGMRCGIWQLINSDGKNSRLIYGPLVFGKKSSKKQILLLATAESQIQSEEDSFATLNEEKLDFLPQDTNIKSSGDICVERSEGKPGLVSFYGYNYGKPAETVSISSGKEPSSLVWFVGPAIVVASLVFPSLYLRKILSMIFEDSLLTDFLILFFTEALFYSGVAIFLLLIDHIQKPSFPLTSKNGGYKKSGVGVRITSVATLVLSLIIPLVTMGFVWPWTGPAASATLAPYLVGIVVQFAFEKYARYYKSPAWLVIPVIFQVYRLHQLNRAAQLVTALSFSVRGAETTPQTLAINSSLGTLFNVLQFLGVICIWSLASFLMRFFPSSAVAPDP